MRKETGRMKSRFLHIKRFCTLAWICSGLASCIYDNEALSAGCGNELSVNFSITVEECTSQSRGTIDDGTSGTDKTWGDDYPTSDGSGIDNRIDMTTFGMALYKIETDNTLTPFAALQAEDLLWFPSLTPESGSTVYRLTAVLQTDRSIEEIRAGTYRVMVWVNTPTTLTGKQMEAPNSLDKLSFENLGVADKANDLTPAGKGTAKTLPTFNLIPMWGCATVSLAGIKPGESYELKPQQAKNGDNSIWLLRSMAKTTVEPGEELVTKHGEDFKIHSVTLVHSNRQGYVMPEGWKTLSDTRTLEFKATARELRNEEDGWKVSTPENTGNTPSLYLPELVNNDNRVHLSVDYTFKGTRKQNKIYFCKYDEAGRPIAPPDLIPEDRVKYENSIYDIVRNHHYRFVIGIDEATAEIVVQSIRIEDWEYGGGGFLDPID